MRICKANVLAGDHNEPSSDIQRILSSFQHTGRQLNKESVMLRGGFMRRAYRASQYNAADPSDPLIDLCKALIISYRSSPVRSYPFRRPRLIALINSSSSASVAALAFASASFCPSASPWNSSTSALEPPRSFCKHTLIANSRLFRACRASPSDTSARNVRSVGGIRGRGGG
jgi:hypothetical protein